jgi:hypothetical protein
MAAASRPAICEEFTVPNLKNHKFFCALPFHHVQVKTSGEYAPCCMHAVPAFEKMNINQHSLIQWQSSRYLREVQDHMLNDQPHAGCAKCWSHEKQGFASLRQRTKQEYEILGVDTDQAGIKNCEIDIDNICNLKCLMCDEKSSSAILAENVKLKINKITQKDIEWSDLGYTHLKDILDIKQLKVLNVRGGEPMVNKKLMAVLEEIPASKARLMLLHITTNGTRFDERWKTVFAKFGLVSIMFSLDAVGPLLEYMRYPACWSEIQDNVDRLLLLPNVKATVHCVVQNLNISSLEGIVRWCDHKKLFLTMDALTSPDYLHLTNLPSRQKDIALTNLQYLLDGSSSSNVRTFVQSCLERLHNSAYDPRLWQAFIDKVSRRDQLRDNSWRAFISDI